MKFSKHHRKPKSLGGTGEPRNITWIPMRKHDAWHLLFANKTAEQIADEISTFYLDPDFELIARRKDVCFSQTNGPVLVATSSPNHGELPATIAASPSLPMGQP